MVTYVQHTVLLTAPERGTLVAWLTASDWLVGRNLTLGRAKFTMAERGQLFISTIPVEPEGGAPRKPRPDPDAADLPLEDS